MNKKPTTPAAKGLVIGLIMVITSLVIYFMDVRYTSALNYLVFAILMLGVVVAIMQYGKEIDHNATFGNYFAHGFKVAAVITLVMIAYMLILLWLIPEFKEKALAQMKEEFAKDKNITAQQVEDTMTMMRENFRLFAAGGTMLYNLIAGVIAALIGAALTKKNPRPVFNT